jgi:uncharacterized protein YjbI with pentapeptide repeats
MKKELDKISENFGEIAENLQKLGGKLKNDFLNGTIGPSEKDNDIKISKVENPSGENFKFENNIIQLSNISKFELINSNFINNSLNAASVKKLFLKNSDLKNIKIQGSSINNLNILESEISDTVFNAVKMSDVALNKNILINNNQFTGISLKKTSLKHSTTIIGSNLNMCAWSDSKIENTNITNSELSGVVFDCVELNNINFTNVKFKDVIFNNVKMININLDDIEISHLHLKDQNIESKKQLLQIIKTYQN